MAEADDLSDSTALPFRVAYEAVSASVERQSTTRQKQQHVYCIDANRSANEIDSNQRL